MWCCDMVPRVTSSPPGWAWMVPVSWGCTCTVLECIRSAGVYRLRLSCGDVQLVRGANELLCSSGVALLWGVQLHLSYTVFA